ncbi:glutathione S-transferase [Glonium stellatum]|uniref:Glutathione S-transferase n=1 Tax=Glonium stellatum TaxID=574774 RepID=A0A8E2JVW1_9PEZI|nr:glutathione S-transferase [Glonium stellatum]
MAPFATIYTTTNMLHARVTKALAAANINGLEVETAPNFVYGETNKTPEFLAKFPMGKIPALETPSGFFLAEGTAIAHYLADSGPKRDQLLGRNPEERALVQMWIGLSDSEIFPNIGGVISPMVGRSEYVEKIVNEKEAALVRAIKRVESHLKGRKWLVDDAYLSLADLSVAASLMWGFKYMLDVKARKEYPETTSWYLRLLEQDGVKEAFGGAPELCEVRGPPFVK